MKVEATNQFLRDYKKQSVSVRRQLRKQLLFFQSNVFHPSLNTEKLEPKSAGKYSFRINRKHRVTFLIKNDVAFLICITNHYQ